MIAPGTDVGAHLTTDPACSSQNAGAPSLVTAGGTGDATKVTGASIDLLGSAGSGILVVSGIAALGAANTLTMAAELQESADNSSWDTAEVIYAATQVAVSAGGGNVAFSKQSSIEVKKRKRYIRFNITPDLNRANTDTCLFSATFSSYDDQLPAT